MEIKEDKVISSVEARKILEKTTKDKELGYEQKNALEYLRKFVKLSEKKAEEMTEELKKIDRLKERHIISIIDHLPQSLDELRLIFSNEPLTLQEEDKKKIIGIVKKYA